MLENNWLYSEILKKVPGFIWAKDLNGRYVFCNEQFEKLYHINHEMIIGKTDYELIDKSIADSYNTTDRQVLDNLETSHSQERIIYEDGSIAIIKIVKSPLYDEENNLFGILGVAHEVTELLDAQEEISSSKKILRDVLNTIPARVFWKDLEGRYMGSNQLFAEDAGENSPEDLIGYSDYDFFLKEEADSFVADDKEVMTSNLPKINIEEPQTDQDGNKKWLSTSKVPLRDHNGEVYGLLGSYYDVTERKQNEIELIHTNEQLTITKKQLEFANEDLREAFTQAEKSHRLEQKHRELGESLKAKTIEDAKKINAVLRVAPVGIGMVANRKIIDINDMVCDMTGYNHDELIGSSARMLYPNQAEYDYVGKEKYRQISENNIGTVETIWQRKDSTLIYIVLSSCPIDANDLLKGVVFTALDITERKQQEEELKKHKTNLEKLVQERTKEVNEINNQLLGKNIKLLEKNTIINDQKEDLEHKIKIIESTQFKLIQAEKMSSLGVLTAGVAHEINNPLNYIAGGYNGLKQYLNGDSTITEDEVNFSLNSIKTGLDRATAIIQGLNQFSRDKKSFDEDCDIHYILDNCLLMLSNQLKHRVQVQKNYTEHKAFIKGNVGQLHQVFINILANAEQSIKNTGKIQIDTYVDTGHIFILISDTGKGISKEDLPRITDPFFTTKEPGKGTGLGLSITYTIIQNHNGAILFNSELNEGTRATINLPIK